MSRDRLMPIRGTRSAFLDFQIITAGLAAEQPRRGTGVRVLGFDISRDCVSRLTVKSLAARRTAVARVRASALLDPLKIDTRSNVIWPRGVSAAAAAAGMIRGIQARHRLRMRSSCSFFGSPMIPRRKLHRGDRPPAAKSCKLLRENQFFVRNGSPRRRRDGRAENERTSGKRGRRFHSALFHARLLELARR